MFLIERSEYDDDASDRKIRVWWWCFWSKDQSMMMMLLIERSEYVDDVSDWKIRVWWWCCWSKDQSMMMMFLIERSECDDDYNIMIMMLLLIEREKCWWWYCWSRGQSIEDVAVDRKVKVLNRLLIKRSIY